MDNFPCLWRGRRYLLRFIVMDVGLDSFELRDLCNQRSGAGDLMSRMSLSEGYQQVDFIRLIRLPLGVQRLLVWVRWRQAVVHEWVFTPMKSSFVVHRKTPTSLNPDLKGKDNGPLVFLHSMTAISTCCGCRGSVTLRFTPSQCQTVIDRSLTASCSQSKESTTSR